MFWNNDLLRESAWLIVVEVYFPLMVVGDAIDTEFICESNYDWLNACIMNGCSIWNAILILNYDFLIFINKFPIKENEF